MSDFKAKMHKILKCTLCISAGALSQALWLYLRGLLVRGWSGTGGREEEGEGKGKGEGNVWEGRKEEGPGPQIFLLRAAPGVE